MPSHSPPLVVMPIHYVADSAIEPTPFPYRLHRNNIRPRTLILARHFRGQESTESRLQISAIDLVKP